LSVALILKIDNSLLACPKLLSSSIKLCLGTSTISEADEVAQGIANNNAANNAQNISVRFNGDRLLFVIFNFYEFHLTFLKKNGVLIDKKLWLRGKVKCQK
jgi:hypothetical protein